MSVATESGTYTAPAIRQTGILIGDEWRPAVSGKTFSNGALTSSCCCLFAWTTPSSTVMTPSAPTFFMASAMILPMTGSLLLAMAATWANQDRGSSRLVGLW